MCKPLQTCRRQNEQRFNFDLKFTTVGYKCANHCFHQEAVYFKEIKISIDGRLILSQNCKKKNLQGITKWGEG